MPRIEVEESALEAIKAMAQRLQNDLNEATGLLSSMDWCYCEVSDDMSKEKRDSHRKVLISVREFLAKCTAEPKVME